MDGAFACPAEGCGLTFELMRVAVRHFTHQHETDFKNDDYEVQVSAFKSAEMAARGGGGGGGGGDDDDHGDESQEIPVRPSVKRSRSAQAVESSDEEYLPGQAAGRRGSGVRTTEDDVPTRPARRASKRRRISATTEGENGNARHGEENRMDEVKDDQEEEEEDDDVHRRRRARLTNYGTLTTPLQLHQDHLRRDEQARLPKAAGGSAARAPVPDLVLVMDEEEEEEDELLAPVLAPPQAELAWRAACTEPPEMLLTRRRGRSPVVAVAQRAQHRLRRFQEMLRRLAVTAAPIEQLEGAMQDAFERFSPCIFEIVPIVPSGPTPLHRPAAAMSRRGGATRGATTAAAAAPSSSAAASAAPAAASSRVTRAFTIADGDDDDDDDAFEKPRYSRKAGVAAAAAAAAAPAPAAAATPLAKSTRATRSPSPGWIQPGTRPAAQPSSTRSERKRSPDQTLASAAKRTRAQPPAQQDYFDRPPSPAAAAAAAAAADTDVQVPCPLCTKLFPASTIQAHANECLDTT